MADNFLDNNVKDATAAKSASDIVPYVDKDGISALILKKIEKLSGALYRITDFWDDRDMLKWRLRQSGVSSVEVLTGSVQSGYNTRDSVRQALKSIQTTISLGQIAYTAGMVSEMNFSIIKREYENILKTLENSLPESQVVLGDTEVGEIRAINTRISQLKDIGHVSDFYKTLGQKSVVGSPLSPVDNPIRHRSENTQLQTGRRDAIVRHIRANPGVSIRDILKVVPGYSEKTIQRELVSLTLEGIVKRTGERRWSRYSVA